MMGFVAVLLAALTSFGLGAVYYMSLAKPWMEAAGMTQEDVQKGGSAPFAIGILVAIASSGMLRHILAMTSIESPMKGLVAGAGIGLFIVGGWIFLNNGYEGKPAKLSLINTGYAVIALGAQGFVLSWLS